MNHVIAAGDVFLNGTMAEAVEKLAEIATGRSTIKQADEGFLSSLGSTIKNNPSLSHALVGGGLGAAIGGAGTAWGNRGKDPSERKSLLGSMATGGLLGAGAGAGVGLARQGMSGLGGGGGMGSDALKPGQYIDPATGKRMSIDPQILKDDPELAAKVKGMTTPTLQSRVAGGVGGVLNEIKEKVPTTAPLVGGAMAVDTALHNPLFGFSKIRPHQAGGRVGTELLQYGFSGDKAKGGDTNPLAEAISKYHAPGGTMPGGDAVNGYTKGTFHELHDRGGPASWAQKKWQGLRGLAPRLLGRPNPPGMADILGGRPGPGSGSRDVASTHYSPEHEIEVTTGKGTPNEMKTKETQIGAPKKTSINEGEIAAKKMFGAEKHPDYAGRPLYRTLGKTYAGAKSMPAAVAARAAIYGLPVAGEYVYRGLQEDADNHNKIRELMQQHAKPVPGQGE